MMNDNINKRLKNAIDAAPIDLLEKIKAMPVEKMAEHDYITRQEEVDKRHKIIKPALSLVAAAAVFLIAYLGWYMPYMKPDSIVYLDVNPSIEMAISRREKVVELAGLNKEGKELVDDMDYKGKDINMVLNDLLDKMLKEGYIDKDRHAMLVSVLNENIDKGKSQVHKLNEIIRDFFKEEEFKPVVLRQSIVTTGTIEEYAKKYNISIGKMTFIKNLLILNPDFELEELIDLSIEELIRISRDTGLDLSKIVDIDDDLIEDDLDDPDDIDDVEDRDDDRGYEDDDWDDDNDDDDDDDQDDDDDDKEELVKERNIIGEARAKSIALSLANGSITDFELDEDDGRLIYKIEIKAKGLEHEIEIDAHTGKVLEHEIDD